MVNRHSHCVPFLKRTSNYLRPVVAAVLVLCVYTRSSTAADVTARLSTRETFVGSPVQLQISIHDARDYDEPTLPKVDGLDIQQVGPPSQSDQISIFNGRQTRRSSVIYNYEVTPNREGTFAIAGMRVHVDGQIQTLDELTLVATKGETGDLLYAEIVGNQKQIYVGQALELTLRLWIKPFQDRDRKITLSEGNMWQMISDRTRWGFFEEKLQQLATQRQRPGGDEVLREDGKGKRRSYYLYEIPTTIYPKKPGKIAGDELRIIVDYPVSLGKSRNPIDDVFGGSPFGGNSPLSQMMDDDFFGSPFGNRLTVTSVRRLIVEAKVEDIQVMSIPEAGRPADYLGAVGNYNMVVEAKPTHAKAGDPITLQIGISGTGPMELVQAPKLWELGSLADDFKVMDQPLAGFVRNDSKYFETEIRPKREGITSIPPIPFSFFDPEKNEFQTVYSQPIDIQVDAADTLQLDDLIAKRPKSQATRSVSSSSVDDSLPWNLRHRFAPQLLESHDEHAAIRLLWWTLVIPPSFFGASVLAKGLFLVVSRTMRRQWSKSTCLKAIAEASNGEQLVDILRVWLERRLQSTFASAEHVFGALRNLGLYEEACRLESWCSILGRPLYSDSLQQRLPEWKRSARELVEQLDRSIDSAKKLMVSPSPRRSREVRGRSWLARARRSAIPLWIFGMIGLGMPIGVAEELQPNTQEVVLKEAFDAYTAALQQPDLESLEAKEAFGKAAQRYQWLVDSGVRNGELYFQLANAYWKSGQSERAIANYERARRSGFSSVALMVNLSQAQSKIIPSATEPRSWYSLESLRKKFEPMESWLRAVVGVPGLFLLLLLCSVGFWGPMIYRTLKGRLPFRPAFALPCLFWCLSASLVWIHLQKEVEPPFAIALPATLDVKVVDGLEAETLWKEDRAAGRSFALLAQRPGWVKIAGPVGREGWVRSDQVEIIE